MKNARFSKFCGQAGLEINWGSFDPTLLAILDLGLQLGGSPVGERCDYMASRQVEQGIGSPRKTYIFGPWERRKERLTQLAIARSPLS